MQIELNDELKAALEQRAADKGMSVSSYANLLVFEQLRDDFRAADRRKALIDSFIDHGRPSTSGRDGRDWREFIHEGHVD